MTLFNHYKKVLLGIFTTVFVMFLTFFTLTANAAVPTDAEVYKATPEGLQIENYTTIASTYNDVSTTANNAKFYPAGSSVGNTTDFIQMMSASGTKSQISSFWGRRIGDTLADGTTEKTVDNYIDLSKSQTISAWIYLGNKDPYSGAPTNGTATSLPDGLAFVLQDDSRGSQAISLDSSGKAAPGETLGVWGSAGNAGANLNSSKNLGNTAIQNSFALEFDTLYNNATSGSDNFFDGMTYAGSNMVKGQHIAWNYPASTNMGSGSNLTTNPNANTDIPQTYFTNSYVNWFTTYYYYGMTHRDSLQNVNLTGQNSVANAWQHFKITYTPPATGSNIATISYVFNDKTYDGKIKPSIDYNSKNSRQIDISRFLKNGNTKIRWGFTASTGSPNSAPSTFAIIMQEMPNVANINVTTALTDLSQYNTDGTKGRSISDMDKRPTSSLDKFKDAPYNVANGDSLRFDYKLKYNSGTAGTGGQIATVLNLPTSVDYTPDTSTALGKDGYVGQILYSGFSDSADNQPVMISASDIVTDSSGNKKLNLSLHSMDTPNQKAEIQIFGKAAATVTPTLVLGAHASFKSTNFIDDTMSYSFGIIDTLQLKNKDTSTDLGTLNINSTTNNTVNLNLLANYLGGSAFDTNGFTLYTSINGETPVSTKIATTDAKTSYDIANDIANSTKFTAQALGVGTHTITVLAIDSMNRASAPISFTVTVQGTELKLTVSNNVSFKDFNYQAANGLVKRNGKWTVTVTSSNTPWTLTAKGNDLTLDGDNTQTMGPMIFRDKNGNDFSLTDMTPIIASNSEINSDTVATDVSGSWGDNDGILLKSEGVYPAGRYTGKIEWNLTESVESSTK